MNRPDPGSIDVKTLWGKDPTTLTDDDLLAIMVAENRGEMFPGDRPITVEIDRQRALDSPSFLATKIIDPFYEQHFEPIHYEVMDECIAPYFAGSMTKVDGQSHNPSLYLGLVLLFSRDTFKSSMLWMSLLWCYLYRKIRLKEDARAMYVHQVQDKAIRRGENIRDVARHNKKFRACFPEFSAPIGDWDTKNEWKWPNFVARAAGESSFVAYGETSNKTGGHYYPRIVDDWETEDLKTPEARKANYEAFRGMGPLKDRSVAFSPYLIAGTTYFWDGTHERILRDGGYLVWKIPAHRGSAKALFDLCSKDPKSKEGAAEIEAGLAQLESERAADLNFQRRLPWRGLYLDCREQGPRIYEAQMRLRTTPEGEEHFDHAALEEIECDKLPSPETCWIYLRCDPAISEKATADELAYVVGAIDWEGRRTVIDGFCGREKNTSKIVSTGFTLARKWQAMGYQVINIGYEATAYQEALASAARYGIPEREAEYHGESVPILRAPCSIVSIHRAKISKHERIMSLDGPLVRRELKVLKTCAIASKLIEQLSSYPQGKRDILDAVHDLWVRTSTPPRPVVESTSDFHTELMKRLQPQTATPKLFGGCQTTQLASWN